MESIWTDAGRTTWPRNPPGWVFLGAAVCEVGKALVEGWHDDDPAIEFVALPLEPFKPAPRAGRRSMGSGGSSGGGPPPTSFESLQPAYERERVEWERRKAECYAENASRAPAFGRSRAAFKMLEDAAIEPHRLRTAYRDDSSGQMMPMPEAWWNGDQLEQRFLTGRLDPVQPFATAYPAGSGRWVFVEAEGLAVLTGAALPSADLPHSPLAELSSVPSELNPMPEDLADTVAEFLAGRKNSADDGLRGVLSSSANPRDWKHEKFAHDEARPERLEYSDRTGGPGRPSSMRIIERMMRLRFESRLQGRTMAEEAEELLRLFQAEPQYAGLATPTAKTLKNLLGPTYRQLKAAIPK